MIIDGNSLAHRAFHAIPILSTSQGIVTNAVYGFTNMLLKVLADLQPNAVVVCFDKGKITFRHDEYGDYKAHRPGTPDELRPQFPLIKELLQAMRIEVQEMEGYEADDLIGTIATMAEKVGLKNIILTGDRDALQLVSPQTKVLLTKKGITELEEYDEGRVWEKMGVSAAQITDYKGLVGDSSDNIPGVPGIGPKTASSLLKQYSTVEKVVAQVDELAPRVREKIRQYGEQALMSKRLATIKCDVPLDIAITPWEGPNYQELLPLFSRLEFKSLVRNIMQQSDGTAATKKSRTTKREMPGAGTTNLETYRVGYHRVKDDKDLEQLLNAARRAGRAALSLDGSRKGGLLSASLALGQDQIYFLPVFSGDGQPRQPILDTLGAICADPGIEKICHDAKNNMWILKNHNIELAGLNFDCMMAAYLLNPGSPNQDLPDLALEHLNVVLPGHGEGALAARADAILRLCEILTEKLRLQEEERLFYKVEMPLVEILARMEMTGVVLDTARLAEMSEELGGQIEALSQQIFALAGEEFNINSTRQLGRILFERLELPVIKKTKTGYSTDADVLDQLAGSHNIVAKVLEYRQLVKLKSTYVDGLAALVDPKTGRVHTTFHQTVTATGRLSSAEPNLQNIPIRLEQGRKIRKVFVPRREGNLILAADYSQIELRVLAHMAGDPGLVEAFQQNQDIHSRTAAEVFGVAMAEVTSDMRGRAKAVNFGIVYGISDFGLAKDIKVTRQEAKRYIDSYFQRYAGVKAYIERTIQEARDRGYVTTILNRRRYLPDLFSPNRAVRNFGERTAMNTPIQGSAADIIKLAMVKIDRELFERGLATRMILQVHDELIFDVPAHELDEVMELVRNNMENAFALDVPLLVDMKVGPNWYEVQKVL